MASEVNPDDMRPRWGPPKPPPPPKVESGRVAEWSLTRQLTQGLKRMTTFHEGRPDRYREEREQKKRRLQEGPETQVGLEDTETRTVVDQKVAKILADDTLPSLEAKGKAALAAVGEAEESWKETSEIFYKLSLIARGQ